MIDQTPGVQNLAIVMILNTILTTTCLRIKNAPLTVKHKCCTHSMNGIPTSTRTLSEKERVEEVHWLLTLCSVSVHNILFGHKNTVEMGARTQTPL
jgi:hypothetical protein